MLCTITSQTPHERFFPFSRRSMLGASLPSWLVTPAKVLLKKFVRSKHDTVCEEVEILDFNPRSSLVRFPMGGKQQSLHPGPSTAGGGQWCPAPPFEIGAPHFTFGPQVAAYIQYCILKTWPSLLVFGPLFFGFWPPLLLNPGDGPVYIGPSTRWRSIAETILRYSS